jgi:hypothetical protein
MTTHSQQRNLLSHNTTSWKHIRFSWSPRSQLPNSECSCENKYQTSSNQSPFENNATNFVQLTFTSQPTVPDTDHEPSSLDDRSTYCPSNGHHYCSTTVKQHELVKVNLSLFYNNNYIIIQNQAFSPHPSTKPSFTAEALSFFTVRAPSLLTTKALSFLTARAPSLLTVEVLSLLTYSRRIKSYHKSVFHYHRWLSEGVIS